MNPETPISDLAVQYPDAARVFIERDIDFCCRGRRPLSIACREKEIEPDQVIDEIYREMQSRVNGEPVDRSPETLVEFILDSFHRPLEKKLGAIGKLFDKVIQVHGNERNNLIVGLRRDFTELSGILHEQQHRKEHVIFPVIVSEGGRGERLSANKIAQEHTKVFELLRQIRCNAGKYDAATAGCTAVRALCSSLNELSAERYSLARIERYLLLSGALYI